MKTWDDAIEQNRRALSIAGWLALIGQNLALIENEVPIDLRTVHEVEFIGGVDHKDWWVHFGPDVYAQVYSFQGELEICTHGYYEDVACHQNPFPEPASYIPGKLREPVPCEIHLQANEPQRCAGLAHWRLNGVATCDECIVNMLERLPDNREWLADVLTDIRERHLKIGARVRIQCIAEQGQLGTVYQRTLNETGWYVRPDRRGDKQPGIACLSDELDVLL